MPTIVVDVMPKAELLDPQGKAVSGALSRLGVTDFSSVRIGKRFELTVEGEVTDEILAEARRIADEVLSNSVIEDVISVHVDGAQESSIGAGDSSTGALTGEAAASTQQGSR